MTKDKWLMAGGGLLVLVGLLLGLTGMTAQGLPCGSAFAPSLSDRLLGGIECVDARSSRQTLALITLIPGALLLAGGALKAYMAWTDKPVRTEPQGARRV